MIRPDCHDAMKAVRLALCGLTVLGFTACSPILPREESLSPAPVVIEGIVIRNQLSRAVTDVMVEVPATGGFAGCGNLMARSSCSTSFQQVDYRSHPIVIRWREQGQPHATDEFVVRIPENTPPGQLAWIEVIIFAPGQAGARLLPNAGSAD